MMYWLYEYVHVDNQVDICTLECVFHSHPNLLIIGLIEGYEIKYGCYFK